MVDLVEYSGDAGVGSVGGMGADAGAGGGSEDDGFGGDDGDDGSDNVSSINPNYNLFDTDAAPNCHVAAPLTLSHSFDIYSYISINPNNIGLANYSDIISYMS